MQVDNLKEKIKPGDIDTAAKVVGITPANGYKALKRDKSKWHKKMLEALELIVANREQLIESGLPQNS